MEYPARSLTGMMAVFIDNRTLTATVRMRREKPIVWQPRHVPLSPAAAVTRPGRRDERGVTLIIFTLMITVMLVFVALAMDSGLVFNERRQDQSAADAAVLAAAQLLLDGGTKAAAAEAVITSSLTNPSRRMTCRSKARADGAAAVDRLQRNGPTGFRACPPASASGPRHLPLEPHDGTVGPPASITWGRPRWSRRYQGLQVDG